MVVEGGPPAVPDGLVTGNLSVDAHPAIVNAKIKVSVGFIVFRPTVRELGSMSAVAYTADFGTRMPPC